MTNLPWRGVLFDMDGLLLDTERLIMESFQHTAQALDLPDMSAVAIRLIGLRADQAETIVRQKLDGRVGFETFYDTLNGAIQARFDQGIPLKSGAVALLDQIANLGLPCAIATSTHADQAKSRLRACGLDHYFQSLTGGDQVENGKPAPDIYHKAAASLGLAAHDCIAFEDSDPGATAAITSGAATIQVPDINQPAPHMANHGHVIAETLLDGARQIGLIT